MSEFITIGTTVGWGSDHIYGGDIYREGVVVAEDGNFLVIKVETDPNMPHISPFAIRMRFHVWFVRHPEAANTNAICETVEAA